MVELKEKAFSQSEVEAPLRFHAMKWNRKMQFVTEEEGKNGEVVERASAPGRTI
jgi:hypothetical protein